MIDWNLLLLEVHQISRILPMLRTWSNIYGSGSELDELFLSWCAGCTVRIPNIDSTASWTSLHWLWRFSFVLALSESSWNIWATLIKRIRDKPHVRVFDFIAFEATLLSAIIRAFAATVFGFNMSAILCDITTKERNRWCFNGLC